MTARMVSAPFDFGIPSMKSMVLFSKSGLELEEAVAASMVTGENILPIYMYPSLLLHLVPKRSLEPFLRQYTVLQSGPS